MYTCKFQRMQQREETSMCIENKRNCVCYLVHVCVSPSFLYCETKAEGKLTLVFTSWRMSLVGMTASLSLSLPTFTSVSDQSVLTLFSHHKYKKTYLFIYFVCMCLLTKVNCWHPLSKARLEKWDARSRRHSLYIQKFLMLI